MKFDCPICKDFGPCAHCDRGRPLMDPKLGHRHYTKDDLKQAVAEDRERLLKAARSLPTHEMVPAGMYSGGDVMEKRDDEYGDWLDREEVLKLWESA